ncbi:MAG: GNAT family N-acetyltransferase [Anaerolineales bacterium]|jgi:RimJ/RimL family protein N-acetyltransferase
MPIIELQPWSDEDLSLLERLNTAEMTKFLGGPESKELLLRRHALYLGAAEKSSVRVLKITYGSNLLPVGQVCYWERTWHDQLVWESGWGVLPAYQGQGVASLAITLLLEKARSERMHRFLHAFPSVENEPSNALCRKFDFTRIEECDFEYPPGHQMRCNDWQIDLFN